MSVQLPQIPTLDSLARWTRRYRKQSPVLPVAGTKVRHIDGGNGYVIDVLKAAEYAEYADVSIKEALQEIHEAAYSHGILVEWTAEDKFGMPTKSYGIHAPDMLKEVIS